MAAERPADSLPDPEDLMVDRKPPAVPDEPRASAAIWRVFAPCIAFAGVQTSWAVQIGHSSAELRRLGVRDEDIGLVWLAGPISGVLVQPIVGVFSDRCTSRLGRRRPFMLLGTVGMVVGLVLFSNAANLAKLAGHPVPKAGGRSGTAIAISIVAFWILDIMINALQGPSRTLLGDVVPPEHQALGNTFFAMANGVGKCIGYAIGAFSERIEVIYGIAAGVAALCALVTIFTVQEEALSPDSVPDYATQEASGKHRTDSTEGVQSSHPGDASKVRTVARTLKRTWAGLFTMPKPVARAFIVQCFAYFAWMIVVVYVADFVGKDVFHGNADAGAGSAAYRNYTLGVQHANEGLLLMAAFSIIVAGLLLPAIGLLGVRLVWATCLAVFGVALLLVKAFQSATYITVMFAMLSLPFAASFTIPWAITALSLQDENERGMYMATFNISQSFPGVIASILGGVIVRAGKGNLAYVMMLGGAAALAGAIAVIFVISPPELQRHSVRRLQHGTDFSRKAKDAKTVEVTDSSLEAPLKREPTVSKKEFVGAQQGTALY